MALLLVDDDPLILHMVQDALEDAGYATVQAADADEAIGAIRDSATEFAGLVTDINLGSGLTGWDVARAARERNAEIPVVYMSGASGHEWAAQGVPNSMIVNKPFAVAQITTAISQLINAAATRAAGLNPSGDTGPAG